MRIIAQIVRLSWTKTARSATGAVAREHLPRTFPLTDVESGGATGFVERVTLSEDTHFAVHRSIEPVHGLDIAWPPSRSGAIHNAPLRIMRERDHIVVWSTGVDRRSHQRTLRTPGPDRWIHIAQSVRAAAWYTTDFIEEHVRVGLFSDPVHPNVFLGRPAASYVFVDDLNRRDVRWTGAAFRRLAGRAATALVRSA
jgi:hypothetical protein